MGQVGEPTWLARGSESFADIITTMAQPPVYDPTEIVYELDDVVVTDDGGDPSFDWLWRG